MGHQQNKEIIKVIEEGQGKNKYNKFYLDKKLFKNYNRHLYTTETRRKIAVEAIILENYSDIGRRFNKISDTTIKRYIKQFKNEKFFSELIDAKDRNEQLSLAEKLEELDAYDHRQKPNNN